MSDDREYRRAIEALRRPGSDRARINRLNRIASRTEDQKLEFLAAAAAEALARGYSDVPERINRITEYCLDAIGATKPQWQLLAEQNGWSPPSSPGPSGLLDMTAMTL